MKLAGDANVLLSAAIDRQAKRVLLHKAVEQVLTTEPTFAEVHEYAPQLAARRGLPPDAVLLAVAALPIVIVERSVYKGRIAEAKRRIGRRDPDDVELLALALHLGVPVWSNDNDFSDCGVEWYTTTELLRKLGYRSRGLG